MRRYLQAFILVAVLLLPSHAPATGKPPHGRALWVWDVPDGGLLRFARNHDINTLYVHVPPGSAGDAKLSRLARQARDAGVRLWAMAGHARWADDPRIVSRWAREVARAGIYDGLVLDIEPYTLDAWDNAARRPKLLNRYLKGLRRAERDAGGLPLLAAVPFWFDHDSQQHRGRSLLDQVLENTDGVVVLAYRDHADGRDGVLRLSDGEVARATELGKLAIVGVQTAFDELDKLTFFEEGRTAMEDALDEVTGALRKHAGFGGIAIHHYESLSRLRR